MKNKERLIRFHSIQVKIVIQCKKQRILLEVSEKKIIIILDEPLKN